MKKMKVTYTERLIMKVMWDSPEELSVPEIADKAQEDFGVIWSNSTVSCYMTMLREKGFVAMTRHSSIRYTYRCILTEQEYKKEFYEKEVVFWSKGDRIDYVCSILDSLGIYDLDGLY